MLLLFAVRLVLIVLGLFISFDLYTLNCVIVYLGACYMNCVYFLLGILFLLFLWCLWCVAVFGWFCVLWLQLGCFDYVVGCLAGCYLVCVVCIVVCIVVVLTLRLVVCLLLLWVLVFDLL